MSSPRSFQPGALLLFPAILTLTHLQPTWWSVTSAVITTTAAAIYILRPLLTRPTAEDPDSMSHG